jgi:hypothetical protein
MAAAAPRSPEEEAGEARDLIVFGQETGRVLSDGRIVGRAEPFAKVFPSSGGSSAPSARACGPCLSVAMDMGPP